MPAAPIGTKIELVGATSRIARTIFVPNGDQQAMKITFAPLLLYGFVVKGYFQDKIIRSSA
jgi:hypothetical protein